MKQKQILTALFLTAGIILATQVSALAAQTFVNKFSSCNKYANDNGKKIVVILGWANRKCYYQEFTSQKTVECAFKQKQLAEITAEMKKKKSQFTSIESLDSAKKYFSIADVCTVEEKNNQ